MLRALHVNFQQINVMVKLLLRTKLVKSGHPALDYLSHIQIKHGIDFRPVSFHRQN